MFSLTPARLLSALILFGAVAVNAQTADQTFTGQAFNFHAGTGACGYADTDDTAMASVRAALFNSVSNICSCNAITTINGTTRTVPIHEAYTDSNPNLVIGFPVNYFKTLNGGQAGIIPNVSWTLQCPSS